MPSPNSCCNPLEKKNHRRIRNNLIFVTANYDLKFLNSVGKYICKSCKTQIYMKSDPVILKNSENFEKISDSESSDEAEDNNLIDSLFVPEMSRNEIEKEQFTSLVQSVTKSSAKKLKLDLSDVEQKNLLGISQKITSQLKNDNSSNDCEVDTWIKDLKYSIAKQSLKSEKIFLLTTMPVDWSVRKTAKVFGVSRRLAARAKKIRSEEGYASHPSPKIGRPLDISIIEKVRNFYLSDEISRVLPGKKDFKSAVIDGKRQKVTKRLVMGNLDELHSRFLNDFPGVQISLAKFQSFRPPQCILVGAKGTHNVCVCKTHQNLRLKIQGLKREFSKKNTDFSETYHDLLKKIVCENPQSECFLLNCKKCPGTKIVTQGLKSMLTNQGIKKIAFQQWHSTDRCQLSVMTESKKIFLENFSKDLLLVLKHDFISKSQAEYLAKLKDTIGDGEFIATEDFSENYSFQVQNEIQSQHWCKDQVTLHVFVVYYREKNVLRNENFVIFSENLQHDSVAVHLFNGVLISHIKKKFGTRNVKKIHYFSDGAASQYKNKYNLWNLIYHKEDFGIDAEWHFFATSHGKGACDGIGGTVKRHAYFTSLQNDKNVLLTSPKALYEWAKIFFRKIHFHLCTNQQHEVHRERLQLRFSNAKAIKNTRSFHSYKPEDNKLLCKIFSNQKEAVTVM